MLKHLFRKNAEFLTEKYVESLISLEYDLPAIDWGQCPGVLTQSHTRNARWSCKEQLMQHLRE
jgi:hypothetical protein